MSPTPGAAMQRLGKMFWFLVVLPTLLGFDWGTKEMARSLPVGGEIPVVNGWLSWVHAENPYIAFSMPVPIPLVVVFGILALAVLAWTLWWLPSDARLQGIALAAIAAGALGNLLDRIGDGSVTDMVRVYTVHPSLAPWLVKTFGTTTWPIFNVADASLIAGVCLWLLHGMTEREREPEADAAS